jgi:imidazolonepropionase-like amidohydrolase
MIATGATKKTPGHLKGLSNLGLLTLKTITPIRAITKENNKVRLVKNPRVLIGVKPARRATANIVARQLT